MTKKIRALWLLNHTTLRKFETKQLENSGIEEIFMPKSFPYDEGNLSANIDFSYDKSLTIPNNCLELLNNQNWYETPSEEAWEAANKYFDVAIIGFFPEQIKSTVRHFKGAIVLRVFGQSKGHTYSDLIYSELGPIWADRIRGLGNRFWFGAGYAHLSYCEQEFIKARNCFLPVGLSGEDESHLWQGKYNKILFVCPRIGSSPYFNAIYKEFLVNFSCFDYTISGAQPVPVENPKVIGFVPLEQHKWNMRQHRVMYYHSAEPNHIHYHPFEAIRAGMPLIFMAGGMLDSLGGDGLPGRCSSIKEAKNKIERLLNNDQNLIKQIRESQPILLEAVKFENCEPPWRKGFQRVLKELSISRSQRVNRPKRLKRIAVIVPVGYRGGSLRGAMLLAQALHLGSRQMREPAEIVFLHLDDDTYSNDEFVGLPKEIKRRPFQFKILNAKEARRAMRYAGHQKWEPSATEYCVPDDGINHLHDCDLWLIVSDRLPALLLPTQPIILMIYDYLQRYVPFLTADQNQLSISASRLVDRVLVTTDFTKSDALQYSGITPSKITKVPMLTPIFSSHGEAEAHTDTLYFIWTADCALHKNHQQALKALLLYYTIHSGQIKCYITGVNTENFFDLHRSLPHMIPVQKYFEKNQVLKTNIRSLGELPDNVYQKMLTGAAFLWHPGNIDSGTFSVLEAASVKVPSLSGDYPAMREIDTQFSLNLMWMDPNNPEDMAQQLKCMELEHKARKDLLPSRSSISTHNVERLAERYWKEVRQCL